MKIKKKIKKKSGSKTEILKNIQVSYEKKKSVFYRQADRLRVQAVLYPVSCIQWEYYMLDAGTGIHTLCDW